MPFVTGPQAVVCAVSAAASSVGPEARAQFSLPPNWTQTWHSIPWLRSVFHARNATKAAIPRIVRSLLRVADMDRGERTPGSDFANVVSHPLQIRRESRQYRGHDYLRNFIGVKDADPGHQPPGLIRRRLEVTYPLRLFLNITSPAIDTRDGYHMRTGREAFLDCCPRDGPGCGFRFGGGRDDDRGAQWLAASPGVWSAGTPSLMGTIAFFQPLLKVTVRRNACTSTLTSATPGIFRA